MSIIEISDFHEINESFLLFFFLFYFIRLKIILRVLFLIRLLMST